MMEAVSTSETTVNFYKNTWCNIPEDSYLHTRHCKNLKSHLINLLTDRECEISLNKLIFHPKAAVVLNIAMRKHYAPSTRDSTIRKWAIVWVNK
jgi:hypothetical protein